MENNGLVMETALASVLDNTVTHLKTAFTGDNPAPGKWFPEGIGYIHIELTAAGVTGKLTIAGKVASIPGVALELENEE